MSIIISKKSEKNTVKIIQVKKIFFNSGNCFAVSLDDVVFLLKDFSVI